ATAQPSTGESKLAESIALSSVQVESTTMTFAWPAEAAASAATTATARRAGPANRSVLMSRVSQEGKLGSACDLPEKRRNAPPAINGRKIGDANAAPACGGANG